MKNQFVFGFLAFMTMLAWQVPCWCQEQSEKVKEVLAQYTKSLGGKQAFEGVKSLRVTGVLKFRNTEKETGLDSNVEVVLSGKRWLKKNTSKEQIAGFDGKQYWNNYLTNRRKRYFSPFDYWDPIATPKKFWNYRGSLYFGGENDDRKDATNRVMVEQTKGDAISDFEELPNEFEFDKKTGLLSKIDFDSGIVEFLEYKKVAGMRICTRHKKTYRNLPWVIEFVTKSVKINPMLADNVFDPPKESP